MMTFLQTLFSPIVFKIVICLAAFVSAGLFVYNLLPDELAAAARKRLGVTEDSTKPRRIALFRWVHLIYVAVVPVFYSTLMPQRALHYFEILKDIPKPKISPLYLR